MNEPRYCEARQIGRRLVVDGLLELTSPAHLGGSDPASLTDEPILRDHQGSPYVPGTTLAGVLRSDLHGLLGGGAEESEAVGQLFGCRWGKEDEEQSALIVDDAPMSESQRGLTELREGVKIDTRTGTAAKGMKFDREFLPVGTRFRLHFELNLAGDASDSIRQRHFLTVLQRLEQGHISIGARTRRGHGRCRVTEWQYRCYDFSQPGDLLQWLGNDGGVPGNRPIRPLQNARTMQQMAGDLDIPLRPAEHQGTMTVALTLQCAASLLIRSGGYEAGDADAVHLHRVDQDDTGAQIPVLSGTSLGGALRHRALKIANTLAGSPANVRARELVEGLFGLEMEENKKPSASKISIDEAVIEGCPMVLRHARVHIDRWRGSALEHMLLEEDALFGGKMKVYWEVNNPSPEEIGLVLCLVKDLFTGDLTVGGESSIGRGILCGLEGKVHVQDGLAKRVIRLKGDGTGSLAVVGGSPSTDVYFSALCQSLQGGPA